MKYGMFLALTLALAQSVFATEVELRVVSGDKTTVLNLKDMKANLKSYTVKLDDPVYMKSKEFDGFLLTDVLNMAGIDPSGESVNEIVFATIDGYAPSVSFAAVKGHKAYVTYQEHSTPGRFALVKQGKADVSPWPFYLIWAEGTAVKDVPWPYQLVKIEVVNFKQKFAKMIPQKASANSDAMKGFVLFKNECMRCHSINLQGGDLGPELNAPQNVTEYWKSDALRDFIQDNAKFRYKSKMPQFKQLSSSQLDQLIDYLKAMKKQKIKNE